MSQNRGKYKWKAYYLFFYGDNVMISFARRQTLYYKNMRKYIALRKIIFY